MRLSDAELARRVRERNAKANKDRRERLVQEGRVQLGGLWIPKATRDRLDAYAAWQAMPLSEVVAAAIDAYTTGPLATAYALAEPPATPSQEPIAVAPPAQDSTPVDRLELAWRGHEFLESGMTAANIAQEFNSRGWTPDKIPKVAGGRPRSDSATAWTAKRVSQLLNRDHPMQLDQETAP